MTPRRELPGPPPSGPSGYLIAAVVMVIVCPAALLAWAWAAWARPRARWWVLPALTLAAAAATWALRPYLGPAYPAAGRDALAVSAAAGSIGPFVLAGAGLLGRHLIRTWPLAMPVGLLAGQLGPRGPRRVHVAAPPPPPKRLERVNVQRSPYLAEALRTTPPGDLPAAWRHGRYLAIPERESRLSRLAVGRPHAGKSVYIARETYLAGRLAQRATLVDCKGEPGFAAEVLDAYRQGWRDGGHPGEPTSHLWPAEPLDAWTGGPAAVVNRLLACWTFDTASLWYREVVYMALRLALYAPGAPVASSADLLYRMQPGVLARLWEENPDQAALVASLSKEHRLDDVTIRVANLLASLGATLDGARPLGTADVTVLSLPVMALESDAAAILRVALADLAHHVTVRKDPAARELIVVDEFSAVPGGRDHAIHLTERGRSAGVAVLLSVQSDRGLGSDADADRLMGAVGAVLLFATAEPERIIRLAGTRRLAEETSTTSSDHGTAYTTSMVWRDAVDANLVRALAPGQAVVLSGGRHQLCQVIRPPGGDGPRPSGDVAWKPAPSDAPARAVDERDYPALPGRVNPAPAAPLRASGVDPSARAGSGANDAPGGRMHPHDDRDPEGQGGP